VKVIHRRNKVRPSIAPYLGDRGKCQRSLVLIEFRRFCRLAQLILDALECIEELGF
jgi:hypothetical protein